MVLTPNEAETSKNAEEKDTMLKIGIVEADIDRCLITAHNKERIYYPSHTHLEENIIGTVVEDYRKVGWYVHYLPPTPSERTEKYGYLVFKRKDKEMQEIPYSRSKEILCSIRQKLRKRNGLYYNGKDYNEGGESIKEFSIMPNALMAAAYAMIGKPKAARSLLEKVEETAREYASFVYGGGENNASLAIAYASAGMEKEAKSWLEPLVMPEEFEETLSRRVTAISYNAPLIAVAHYVANCSKQEAESICRSIERQTNRHKALYYRDEYEGNEYEVNPCRRFYTEDNALIAILNIIIGKTEEAERMLTEVKRRIHRKDWIYYEHNKSNLILTVPNALMAIAFAMLEGKG